jgi:hypothetical protein
VVAVGWLVILAGLAALVGSSAGGSPTPFPTGTLGLGSGAPTATPAATPTGGTAGASPGVSASASPADQVLVGAGDIAACGLNGDEATARLVETIPGTVFTAGDNAYESGTAAQFQDCYDPTWGRFKDRTRPAAGNHDWVTSGAAGYLGYFGSAATNADGQTWYSYDLGSWHVIVLDSDCSKVGGCDPGSPQGRWLAADLAASRTACSIAIWHHPRFSSGFHGSDASMEPLWRAVAAAGVELVVNGHDHDYERFGPQDADGRAADDGTREFVVGTGGAALRDFATIRPNSLTRASGVHGVLQLTLRASGYTWRFVSVDGVFSDQGSAACH